MWRVYREQEPLSITCPPETGRVDWITTESDDITILTRIGVQTFDRWMRTKDFKMIVPPLAAHEGVPALPGGIPDVYRICKMVDPNAGGTKTPRELPEAEKGRFWYPRKQEPFIVFED